jgi:hypothetical protein
MITTQENTVVIMATWQASDSKAITLPGSLQRIVAAYSMSVPRILYRRCAFPFGPVWAVSGYRSRARFYAVAASEKVILEDDKNVFFRYIERMWQRSFADAGGAVDVKTPGCYGAGRETRRMPAARMGASTGGLRRAPQEDAQP